LLDDVIGEKEFDATLLVIGGVIQGSSGKVVPNAQVVFAFSGDMG